MNKKEVLFFVALFLVVVNLFHFLIIVTLTGNASASNTGTAFLCLGKAPQLSLIPTQSAVPATIFTYQANATFFGPNTSITYSDNTSLFDINQSGYIQFTPQSADNGTHPIEITVIDASGCMILNASTIFNLTISSSNVTTPVSPGAPGEAVSGGTGAEGSNLPPIKPKIDFEISDRSIGVNIKRSQSIEKNIVLSNKGNMHIEFSVSHSLSSVLEITPSAGVIPIDGTQELLLRFNPSKRSETGVYTGTITITGMADGKVVTKEIQVTIEIESDIIIVDASLDLPKKETYPGDDLTAVVMIVSLGQRPVDTVLVLYRIHDFNGKEWYQEREDVSFDMQTSFTKEITLPEDIPPGKYILSLSIISGNSFGTATESFTILSREKGAGAIVGRAAQYGPAFAGFIIPLMLLIIIILFFVIYIIERRKEKKKKRKR
ncbi:TPA: hypothetical protein HA241_01855 [Candidatus Woesearchaeota archaeon]|nr:hypothetical protein [Candidatus Woesearchaeota archaeon]